MTNVVLVASFDLHRASFSITIYLRGRMMGLFSFKIFLQGEHKNVAEMFVWVILTLFSPVVNVYGIIGISTVTS